jgi:hypothetical protein
MRRRLSIGAAAILGSLSLLVVDLSCANPAGEAAATAPAATTQPATNRSIAIDLQGSWTGSAHAVVQWVQNPKLLVKIDIAADGSVAGMVGDATLVDGRLVAGRSEIERALGWGRDYRIHAKLAGDIIKAEGIRRDSVDIVFDRRDDNTVVGGLSSNGSEFGGKESMRLAAQKMTLRREPTR